MRKSRHLGVYSPKRKWNLFDNGKIDTKLTGGLNAYAYAPSTSGSAPTVPTYTQGDGFIRLELDGGVNGKAGALFTEIALDLTKKKTLYIEVTSASTQTELGGYIKFGATSTKANKYVVAASKTICSAGSSVQNTTLSLDISDLSGSYYLFVNLYACYAMSVEFTRWWVE